METNSWNFPNSLSISKGTIVVTILHTRSQGS